MITLDTSGLYALLNRRDPDHQRVGAALKLAGRPYLVPAAILAEIAYLVKRRMPTALDPFLQDLETGAFSLDCGERDPPRRLTRASSRGAPCAEHMEHLGGGRDDIAHVPGHQRQVRHQRCRCQRPVHCRQQVRDVEGPSAIGHPAS